MKTTRIRIGLLYTENTLSIAVEDENNYWAEAIEDDNQFHYRAKGVTVDITEAEFKNVIANPKLYYFSTALRLHVRLKNAGGLPVPA